MKTLNSKTTNYLMIAATLFAVSCGGSDVSKNDTSGDVFSLALSAKALKNVPTFKFKGEKKDNIIAPDLQAFNAKSGCKYEPETSIEVESYYRSSFEPHISYIFKPSSTVECPLDQGYVNLEATEKNDVLALIT